MVEYDYEFKLNESNVGIEFFDAEREGENHYNVYVNGKFRYKSFSRNISKKSAESLEGIVRWRLRNRKVPVVKITQENYEELLRFRRAARASRKLTLL